jgi:hypothetical protein
LVYVFLQGNSLSSTSAPFPVDLVSFPGKPQNKQSTNGIHDPVKIRQDVFTLVIGIISYEGEDYVPYRGTKEGIEEKRPHVHPGKPGRD